RTANLNLKRTHPVFLRLASYVFRSNLSSKRGRLTRALETLCTCRRPGNRVALCIGDRDHGVVERGVDVSNARRNIFTFATANASGFLGHLKSFRLISTPPYYQRLHLGQRQPEAVHWPKSKCDYFFLPAIAFAGPLRVRALVCVRWPRTGSERR